jgi:DNA-binding NtrC family response regulator
MSMRDELDHLVFQMLTRGIRYDDAHREFEKRFISHALKQSDGNVGQAAELLGMHRNTLSRKLQEYRLRRTA